MTGVVWKWSAVVDTGELGGGARGTVLQKPKMIYDQVS